MSNIKPAEFWLQLLNTEEVLKTPSAAATRRANKVRVLRFLCNYVQEIYTGDLGARFGESEFNRFTDIFRKKESTQEYLLQVKFLIQGLEIGKSLYGWENVVVPSIPLTAPREPARFTPHSFFKLNQSKPVHTSFCKFLEKSEIGITSSPKFLGSILLSAVLYGGLLSREWLTPLLRGLPDKVRVHGDLMWLDLERPYIYPKHEEQKEKTKYIHRRWFPDPLTQTLIVQLHTRFQEHIASCSRLDAQLCLKVILHDLVPEKTICPSISDLYKGAATWLGLRIPSFLVSYATGKTMSVSLPPHAWTRLLLDKNLEHSSKNLPDTELNKAIISRGLSAVFQGDDLYGQDIFRKKLAGILSDARKTQARSTETRKKIESFLNGNGNQMIVMLHLLCSWSIELLSSLIDGVEGRKNRTALRPSSVGTYLSAIGEPLIACAGSDNILEYDAEELRSLYEHVISTNKAQKRKTSCAVQLVLFHQFLMRVYGTPTVDMDNILSKKGPPELAVDAGLFSPNMFRFVLKALGWELESRDRLQTVRCLITILGYRCGLRRNEARCIRICDIFGEVQIEILVRTSSLNRTKTHDSKRRVPVSVLLEEDESHLLMLWKRNRIAEEGMQNIEAPLFAAPGSPVPYDEADIFPAIHEVMRLVSGNNGSRYHHLRHSLPNWLLITLLSDYLVVNGQMPSGVKPFQSEFHKSAQLKQALFGNMQMGRQYLYGISALLGHADPGTTFNSYIHLCDLLLGLMLRRPECQPRLTQEAAMQLTGLKRAMLFRSKSEYGQTDWIMGAFLERQSRHVHHLFLDPLAKLAQEIPEIEPLSAQPRWELPNWRLVAHVLEDFQIKGIPYKKIATLLKLSPITVTNWCETAASIREMDTRNGKPRHLTAIQIKSNPRNRSKIPFPGPIKPIDERKMVDSIFKPARRATVA